MGEKQTSISFLTQGVAKIRWVLPPGKRYSRPIRLTLQSHHSRVPIIVDHQRRRLTSTRGDEESLEGLAEAAVGDEAAFERLVRLCYGRIHRWALVATADSDDADDVVQETLVRMHRSLVDYRQGSRFTTWLYRITHSAVLDHGRRRTARWRKRLRLSLYRDQDQQDPPGIEQKIEEERLISLIKAFWNELPAGQRQVFDLVDLQGYGPSEVADMMEMNPATVRAHLFKARRTIRCRIFDGAQATTKEEAR